MLSLSNVPFNEVNSCWTNPMKYDLYSRLGALHFHSVLQCENVKFPCAWIHENNKKLYKATQLTANVLILIIFLTYGRLQGEHNLFDRHPGPDDSGPFCLFLTHSSPPSSCCCDDPHLTLSLALTCGYSRDESAPRESA